MSRVAFETVNLMDLPVRTARTSAHLSFADIVRLTGARVTSDGQADGGRCPICNHRLRVFVRMRDDVLRIYCTLKPRGCDPVAILRALVREYQSNARG